MFEQSTIKNMLPHLRKKDRSEAEYAAMVKAELQFVTNAENKIEVKRNGLTMKHPHTTAPLTPEQAIAELFKQSGWIDETAGQIKTLSELQKKWLEENPKGNIISPEFTDHVSKHAKEVKDFNYYS
jgi:hypothetical protein